ncbi:MAG: ubiquinone/menaquinone biosynthesis C-methylase UbiE [Myxococcota bacterium]|jgi:ubiquinone/menaquinone biosynthesis C-methylase UbiE
MKASLSDTIKHFDALAPERMTFTDDLRGQWDRDMHQEVLNLSELDENSVLLELGCGTGRFTHMLSPHVKQSYAIDCSPNMLRMARERTPPAPKTLWIPGDLRDLPKTEGVNTVVMCNTVRYLDPEERDVLFRELHRRLPIGGLLIIGGLLWSMPPDMIEGVEGWMDDELSHVIRVSVLDRQLKAVGFDTYAKRMHPAIGVLRAAKIPRIQRR